MFLNALQFASGEGGLVLFRDDEAMRYDVFACAAELTWRSSQQGGCSSSLQGLSFVAGS